MDRDIGLKFGKRLRELREAKDMTQAQLGKLVRKSVETISNVERGKSLPGLLTITQFATVLEVPVRDLFEFDEPAAASASGERVAIGLAHLTEPDRHLVADFVDLLYRRGRSP